jgi:hypothetical protein
MAFFHHGSIRKYTAALIELFNDIEIQYGKSNATTQAKKIPLKYSAREKSRIFDEYTTEQILSGNFNVLPRASISLQSMTKSAERTTNKNLKINTVTTDQSMDFMYNSVPYEFAFELVFQCRGMNEATQIIEQIAPRFNPTVNIDVWDAGNLSEPTRIPVKLLDINLESEEYDEISSNIFVVSFSIGIVGNLYPPIKSQERVQAFRMTINEIYEQECVEKSLMEWDVDLDGYIDAGTLDTIIDSGNQPGSGGGTGPGTGGSGNFSLAASRVSIEDLGAYYESDNVEDALQEIAEIFGLDGTGGFNAAGFEIVSNKNQPNGYAGLDGSGKVISSLLPSYVDDVVEYANLVSLPATGESGKIYLTLDTNDIYRWTGSTYVKINNSVSIADSAYRLENARTITISGDATGSAVFDGTQDIDIAVTIAGTTVDIDNSSMHEVTETDVQGVFEEISRRRVITTDKILISNNKVDLPYKTLENIESVYVYEENNDIITEYTCTNSVDNLSVEFDPLDNLNGFMCKIKYFAAI